jgi:hypothetical protein
MKSRLILFLLLCANMTFAYKVTPITQTLTISSGKTQDFSINLIRSIDGVSEKVKVYPADFSMTRQGSLVFGRIVSEYSAYEWINIEKDKYQIPIYGDNGVEVKIKIHVPFGTKPGEYYISIMTEPESSSIFQTKEKIFQVERKELIAVTLLIIVPGRKYEKKGIALDSIKVESTDNQSKIFSTFKSESEIHLGVSGEATVRSKDGRINFGKIKLDVVGANSGDKAFVFPHMMRDFEGVLDRPLPTGEYRIDVSYNYGYDFKKAQNTHYFSIQRKSSLNENKDEFLSLKNKELNLLIPKGGRRTQALSVTNTDYRDLSVEVISSNDWVKINPNIFVLIPGEIRNIMLTISISGYDDDKVQQKYADLCFKTDRGKSSDLKLNITGLKENLKK